MTLNGVTALIFRYFTELVYEVVVKKFTFAISSPDEFLCQREQTLAYNGRLSDLGKCNDAQRGTNY